MSLYTITDNETAGIGKCPAGTIRVIFSINNTCTIMDRSFAQNATTTLEVIDFSNAKRLHTIRQQAFFDCTLIKTLILPPNIKKIEFDSFEFNSDNKINLYYKGILCKTTNLPPIPINSNISYTKEYYNNGLIYNDPHQYVFVEDDQDIPSSNRSSIVFGFTNAVTAIPNYFSSACKSVLTSINFTYATSLKSIGNNAFQDCNKLTGPLLFPDSLITIYDNAFQGCVALVGDLLITKNIATIGNNAFRGCTGYAGGKLKIAGDLDIGDFAFFGTRFITIDIQNRFITAFQPNSFNVGSSTPIGLFYAGEQYTGVTGDENDIPPIPITGQPYAPATYYNDGNILCYSKGAKILCKDGYIKVEDLVVGELVKTLNHGYLEVENIVHGRFTNDPNNWNRCMYRLPKEGGMTDDLIVTGGHGILVDSLPDNVVEPLEGYYSNEIECKIDNQYLLVAAFCDRFEKIESTDLFDYYHFSLKGVSDRRYAIWANGVLSESTFNRLLV